MSNAHMKPKPQQVEELELELTGLAGHAHRVTSLILETIIKLLKHAGLTGKFIYNITGRNRNVSFGRPPGIKIKGETNACSLVVYAGGDDQYAGYLIGHTGIRGYALFQHLERFTIKRYFYPVDVPKKKMETLKRMEELAEGANNESTSDGIIPQEEPVSHSEGENVNGSTVHHEMNGAIPEMQRDIVPEEEQRVSVAEQYRTYLDDPHNMHLSVFGLVLACNEDVNRPFNMNQFMKMLHDSGLPESYGIPPLVVRIFLTRGFIVKINENKPALYTITPKAVQFAKEPEPTGPVLTVKMELGKSRIPSRTVATKQEDTEARIKATRQKLDEQQRLRTELGNAQQKLSSLNKDSIDSEETNINGEIRSLTARLKVLEEGLVILAKRREEVVETETVIANLELALQAPEFEKAAQEMAALRQQIESMLKLLG